jgi:hypothetical protein
VEDPTADELLARATVAKHLTTLGQRLRRDVTAQHLDASREVVRAAFGIPTVQTARPKRTGWHTCPACGNPTRGTAALDDRCAKCQASAQHKEVA